MLPQVGAWHGFGRAGTEGWLATTPSKRGSSRAAVFVDQSGKGYGLGLAIVHAIADAHNAALTARARPAGGLDIDVTFPPPISTDRP